MERTFLMTYTHHFELLFLYNPAKAWLILINSVFFVLVSSCRDFSPLSSSFRLSAANFILMLIYPSIAIFCMLLGLFASPQPPQNDSSYFIVQSDCVLSSPCLQTQLVTSLWKPAVLFTCSSTQWDISFDSFSFFYQFSNQKEMV